MDVKARTALGLTLAASVAGNVYLLMTRGSSAQEPTRSGPHSRSSMPLPELKFATTAAPRPDLTSVDRSSLEQRLVTTEARIEDLKPAEERYATEKRTVETEASVKSYLDAVFAPLEGAEPKYQVECHGVVCKLDTNLESDWMGPLQSSYPGRARFKSMSFGRSGTFLQLWAPGEDAAMGFLGGIYRAMMMSGRPALCSVNAVGDLTVTMFYVAKSQHVTVKLAGSLADEPFGACIKQLLDEAIAKNPFPPDANADANLTFPTIELRPK